MSWRPRAASAPAAERPIIHLQRGTFDPPARELLPGLERYARLALGGEERLVGYVEASHGCVHRCRHCPVPAVYDGRIRVVQAQTVLRDVERLAGMGARHITFGDPDFLNGWRHSLAIVRALHERHPELTFDCTTKVEHVLEHARLWEEMAASGCLFVVCALESVNDEILVRLEKGHTTAEAVQALDLLREHGIETRPSFMPFTPWTTPRDVLEIVEFVAAHDLVANVDPVQYTIRLLVPEGSLLLEQRGPTRAPRPIRGRAPQLPVALSGPCSRPAAGPPQRAGPAERRRAGGDGPDVRSDPRGGARGDRRGVRPGAAGHPDRIDRGEATAHRAVVLLSGAHRGPVRSSHNVKTRSGGSPASAAYRSGKQPTRTPATVPTGNAAPTSPSARPRSSAHQQGCERFPRGAGQGQRRSRTHGKVLASLSQAHVEPDLTIEIFLMDGPLAGFGALELVDLPGRPGQSHGSERIDAPIASRASASADGEPTESQSRL